MPFSSPSAASSALTSRQSKVLLSCSLRVISPPASICLPSTVAPRSELTRATGTLSRRLYGSQKDQR